MRGGSLVKLQAILWHVSIRTTHVYARLAPDDLSGGTAILEGLGTPRLGQIQHMSLCERSRAHSVWYNYASLQHTAAYPSG
jgi:hypothetical protein